MRTSPSRKSKVPVLKPGNEGSGYKTQRRGDTESQTGQQPYCGSMSTFVVAFMLHHTVSVTQLTQSRGELCHVEPIRVDSNTKSALTSLAEEPGHSRAAS